MIPKIIHYCWFGHNPLPKLAQECIATWKKHCPDYEIKEWNEDNIDISCIGYMQEAYEEKAWGFVSDVARLQIIYEHGGIYLDTDVEILKSFDTLLHHTAFMGMEDGRFNKKNVALGLGFGAEKGNELIGKFLYDYQDRHFRNKDGTLDRTPCPVIQTAVLTREGFRPQNKQQTICGAIVYPTEFFSPYSPITGISCCTSNSYSIHHYDGSWITEEEKALTEKKHLIYQKYGYFAILIWASTWICQKVHTVGIRKTFRLILNKICH